MIRTMQDIARIGEEIQKGHAKTNAEINHRAYLNLTGQEDYDPNRDVELNMEGFKRSLVKK